MVDAARAFSEHGARLTSREDDGVLGRAVGTLYDDEGDEDGDNEEDEDDWLPAFL